MTRIASALRRGGRPALRRVQEGKWGYVLAWLIGVPVPVLIVIFLLRGCS